MKDKMFEQQRETESLNEIPLFLIRNVAQSW